MAPPTTVNARSVRLDPAVRSLSALPKRRLGAAGPEVGAIGLGCMSMSAVYGPGDEEGGAATSTRPAGAG